MATILRPTKGFEKTVRKLHPEEKGRVAKVLGQFILDRSHPGLSFEWLRNTTSMCMIRVSGNHRIIMRQIDGQTFDLIEVVNHDKMATKYGIGSKTS